MLANAFGHFDPSGRAFTITNPNTPMPWCNVICNGRFGTVVSQNGGGFSWFDDAQHCVLTRWEMDLVRDSHGKFLLLADRDSGALWSLAPAPIRPNYAAYSCTHTLGSTTFRTEFDRIEAKWTITVAPDDAVELWMVELTNTTDHLRHLRLSSYFEWCCGVAPDAKREFHRLFFTTKHDAARSAILATKNMWDIPSPREKDHWNIPWPYVAAHAVAGMEFDTPLAIADKARFLGRYGSPASPAAMKGPIPNDGGFGRFGDASASLGGDLTLQPGQSVKLHFILAIAPDEPTVLKLVDKFREAKAAASLAALAEKTWVDRLARTAIESERPDFDLLNNYWLPYQAISGRLWGRTGYYQQSGARGFRDQLQDSQVWLPLEPARTLDQIMLHATRQFKDGSVNHWWHALANFGNHTACSDDYLWLPFLVANYIKETGDFACLSRTTKWMDRPDESDLAEHCLRAIDRAFRRMSPRRLPLIGSCDWNDGLSAMGINGRGESFWLAMFLCQILEDWAIILDRLNDPERAASFRTQRTQLADNLNALAWDGNWYRYGTKDSGEVVGSSGSPAGKIHLNAQTWAILTNIAPPDRAKAAWQSVHDHLLSPYGPLLLAPAYTEPDDNLGYITRYSPGSRENGGVYMHAATWALAAAAKLKDVDAVGRIYRSIAPPTRGQDPESYWAEPYVTPGNVDGPLSDKPGRAGWTWYTGSAAWLNRVCLEWILGIRPEWATSEKPSEPGATVLRIDPCPPAFLGKVSATRTWRGRKINIRFDAHEFAPGKATTLIVNGTPYATNALSSDLVSNIPQGKAIEVEVRWLTGADGLPPRAASLEHHAAGARPPVGTGAHSGRGGSQR
jgi:cellobiose phosphorylase